METLDLARRYLTEDGGVVAVDLAGAEALFPTESYKNLFAKAKEYNVPFTIHAGEAGDAEDVKTAIRMGASRIGHGVRIAGNEEVIQLVKNSGIFLEMCPIERTTLSHEFQYMDSLLNLTEEQKKQLLLNSVEAAFTSGKRKRELKEQFLF